MHTLEDNVRTGLERFQRGNFHAAHEAWEDGWTQAKGAERHLLQALVQLAAGFYQWSRGKPEGAATLFSRARGHLEAIPSTLLGVEVSELELELEGFEEAAARGEAPPDAPRLRALNPPATAPAHVHRHSVSLLWRAGDGAGRCHWLGGGVLRRGLPGVLSPVDGARQP